MSKYLYYSTESCMLVNMGGCRGGLLLLDGTVYVLLWTFLLHYIHCWFLMSSRDSLTSKFSCFKNKYSDNA